MYIVHLLGKNGDFRKVFESEYLLRMFLNKVKRGNNLTLLSVAKEV